MSDWIRKFFGRPVWTTFFHVSELIVIDLLLGIVLMLALFAFSKCAEWLRIDSKEILMGVTFARLFRAMSEFSAQR